MSSLSVDKMLRIIHLLILLFSVVLATLSSAQEYFVQSNRAYIIEPGYSESSETQEQLSPNNGQFSDLIWRSDVPISHDESGEINEYATEVDHLPIQQRSQVEFQLSKNPRNRFSFRRHRRPHHHDHHSSHHGHGYGHGYGYGSTHGHGWDGGHGGYGHDGHGGHGVQSGHGWQNNDGWGEGNIGGTHALYIGSGGGSSYNHGYGHSDKYYKKKLKYEIYKLKARKKIALLQTGIGASKLVSSVLQSSIKGLGWLH